MDSSKFDSLHPGRGQSGWDGHFWDDEPPVPGSARCQACPPALPSRSPQISDQYGIAKTMWVLCPPAHHETSVKQPRVTQPVMWFAKGVEVSEPIANVNLLVNIQE